MNEGPNPESGEQPEPYSTQVQRQQRRSKQLELFDWRCGEIGSGGTTAESCAEQQPCAASERKRAPAHDLLEQVVSGRNMWLAYKRVKANRGSAGIDRMTVDELLDWLKAHYDELCSELLNGRYRPRAVLGVQIPKASGGMRQLGIPVVVDRLIQQAIAQVIGPLWEVEFSDSSYGFRPGRSAHDALRRASAYVEEGRGVVVDMDLEKFFDRVHHDILMSRLARRIGDRRLLRLIRRFLEAGMMQNGVLSRRRQGTPQGGPLSPLLSNILLDDLDNELERRGHRFVRYADDCNIYVRSQKAGERVMTSVERFLERRLRLRINRQKSAVAPVHTRRFLGYRLLQEGSLTIAPESRKRCRRRLRWLTRRKRGISLKTLIDEVNSYLTGWVTYFAHAKARTWMRSLAQWLRRRLRCFRIKQQKWNFSLYRFYRAAGVAKPRAWAGVLYHKGWWSRSATLAAQQAMTTEYFDKLGLINPLQRFDVLQDDGNRRMRRARTVV